MKYLKLLSRFTVIIGLTVGLVSQAYSVEGTIQTGDNPWLTIDDITNPTYLVTASGESFFSAVDQPDGGFGVYDAVTAQRINLNGEIDITLPDTLIAQGPAIVFNPITGEFVFDTSKTFAVYSIDTSTLCTPPSFAFGITVRAFSVVGAPVSSRQVDAGTCS